MLSGHFPARSVFRVSISVRGIVLLVLSTIIGAATASDVYRWKDKQGRVHYADRAPAGVQSQRFRQEPESVDDSLELEVLHSGTGWDVYLRNRLQGPVQAQLKFARQANVTSEPAMPFNAVLPPKQRQRVARIDLLGAHGDFTLDLRAVPGDPFARSRDVSYRLPFDEDARYRIGQAFHGGFTHNDEQNRFAVDFALPIGTPVLAARGGVVMQTSGDFERAGTDKRLTQRANFIRVLHDDGSMGLYAHLQQNGVMVREGQKITLGQLIGYSGNTGYSTGPHLHYCVQINRDGRLISIPFRMVGPDGFLNF